MNRHHHPPHPPVASFQTAGLLTSVFFFLFIVPQFFITTVNAIDCFKCVSVNGANPACEDPFHNNFTSDLLESPCLGGRKGRNGLFPATACLKLAGRYADGNYEKMVIRTCALDSGSLTLDTELVRMSHCGSFVLDGRSATDISIKSTPPCFSFCPKSQTMRSILIRYRKTVQKKERVRSQTRCVSQQRSLALDRDINPACAFLYTFKLSIFRRRSCVSTVHPPPFGN
ncbi:hypothetical protein GHT06_012966 [Daphnia sinensis]|uniref:Protein sleepless n=1 Tax=Daphnia sinensis TaxID=1820382 RepID=A0AAD5KX21_9CRUS|nr:hypothetical protein GHT06_012966 [Daphnia sinensis]